MISMVGRDSMGSQNKGTTLLTSDRLRVVDPVDSLCIAEWVNNYHICPIPHTSLIPCFVISQTI
jgi:hypothetical protein